MSVFVVIFSVAVFLLAGLLVDGGAAINARLRAADVAEQGARAAADQIDVEALRANGQVRLLADEGAVCGRAGEIVAAHDDQDVQMKRCEIGGGQAEVTVEVGVRWNAVFLSVLGFGGSEMAATATAGPDAGDA
ncbi:pilus assembly protein TadG-related protein [Microtetraspora glauca]|uniref:Pilus assembly protein TadG-related protein n=1 Tax=Microtetraspora glauca TaxID=1996 RepID=A0ABV3G7B2_MICGL